MFTRFLLELRAAGIPASVTEYLSLLGAMQAGVAAYSVDDFYCLGRAALVKDERHLDRFDRVFASVFRGLEPQGAEPGTEEPAPRDLPEDWLRRMAETLLSPEEQAQVRALGGFEALMETLRQRLAEQTGRHQGGSKWVGTAGTSPFGAYGYNPEGVRIGQEGSRHRRAVKVWDRREFRDLDDGAELGTRGMKLALRRLRRFARQGRRPSSTWPHGGGDGGQCRVAGRAHGAGAAQRGAGAAAARRRRVDGRPRARHLAAVLRRAGGVRPARALLLS